MCRNYDQETEHLQLCTLLDFYGCLLNSRQKDIMKLFYYEDFSLAEISALKGISRQAVNSTVHRAAEKLREFERSLKLVEFFASTRNLRLSLETAIHNRVWEDVESVLRDWHNIERVQVLEQE
ncbi:MAG: sigma factor-like helix-turn-helix DNA-binding protein [Saccharofermentanales bacterium]|jgi:predicted DNA-binding protein YlxM (UPF0122 family)|nr:sigma factor-like helix-turn-helix DNA-binding protein [Bacillota bacterium]